MTKERFVELGRLIEAVISQYGCNFIRTATWGHIEHILTHFVGISDDEARMWNEFKDANN